MTKRVAVKTTLDSAFGSLIAIGIAGLSFGVYDQNVVAGLFGTLCVLIGIILNYSRNNWNEGEKMAMQSRMEESVEKKVVRRLKK
jgi:hypothetical protein